MRGSDARLTNGRATEELTGPEMGQRQKGLS